MRLRVLTTLAVLVAAIGVIAVGATTAAGQVEYNYNPAADPQTTNVPWLAWAGETVKVSRCFGLGDSQINQQNVEAIASSKGFDLSNIFVGEFDKADWSGATDQPPYFQTGTGDQSSRQVSATFNPNGGICFSTDVTSLKAGLEDIDFSISTDLGWCLNQILGQDIVFQQDLFVIWMWDSAPAINEAADTGAYQVGDPGGSGTFAPIKDPTTGLYSFHPGLINVNVTGTFPLGNDYADLDFSGTVLGNGTITLPTDWVWLANHFSEDYSSNADPRRGASPNRWDIHDDDTNAEGHIAASNCTDKIGLTESVDNCNGSGPDPDLGPFSSIFGLVGTSNDAMGPFDPIRSFETLLSDGNLNADDAPMPALRVDVSLTNANDDHAAGYLSKADKSLIYNRNTAAYGGNGADLGDPHMLYAPFYRALVPAVTPLFDLNSTSGVEGSLNAAEQTLVNSSWLTWSSDNTSMADPGSGVYDYWDTFTQESTGGYNNCYGADGNQISKPDNVEDPGTGTSVSVYTDEHGQAMVQFNPANPDDGEGINLTPDGNGRCDVYTGSLDGTATIQAQSFYPAKQPSDPSDMNGGKLSNILSKTVHFTPNKVLSCIAKGKNEAYCVETVTDFEGNPIKADVEFTAQGFNSGPVKIQPDSNAFGGFDPRNQTVNDYDALFVDLTTDPTTGQAAIAVHDSINECVNVSVENLGTENGGPGIYRDFDFNPAAGTTCGTNTGTGPTGDSGPPPPDTGTPASTQSGGGTPNAVQQTTAAPVAVTSPAPTAAPKAAVPAKATKTAKVAKKAKAAKMTLVAARVVSTHSGRYLNVRVNSKAKVARLHITLVRKNHTTHRVTRYVHTNHMVRVAKLRLGANVSTVRVAVA